MGSFAELLHRPGQVARKQVTDVDHRQNADGHAGVDDPADDANRRVQLAAHPHQRQVAHRPGTCHHMVHPDAIAGFVLGQVGVLRGQMLREIRIALAT